MNAGGIVPTCVVGSTVIVPVNVRPASIGFPGGPESITTSPPSFELSELPELSGAVASGTDPLPLCPLAASSDGLGTWPSSDGPPSEEATALSPAPQPAIASDVSEMERAPIARELSDCITPAHRNRYASTSARIFPHGC